MATKRLWTRVVFGGLLVLAAGAAAIGLHTPRARAGSENKDTATVSFLEGTAFRGPAEEGPWTAVAAKEEVAGNQWVKTGPSSRMELTLGDGSVIRLSADTKVEVKSLTSGPTKRKSSVRLWVGQLWSSVTRAFGPDDTFEVETENAVAGVRGTTFRVNRGTDKATVVKVYAGAVAVANPSVMHAAHKPGERVLVQGPTPVTKKQWEEVVLHQMQAIKVAATGEMETYAFTAQEDADSWVLWNQERDKAQQPE